MVVPVQKVVSQVKHNYIFIDDQVLNDAADCSRMSGATFSLQEWSIK